MTQDEMFRHMKESGYNVTVAKEDRVVALNEALKGMAHTLGLYDFGGSHFIAPSSVDMGFNGDKHETYVITFEK